MVDGRMYRTHWTVLILLTIVAAVAYLAMGQFDARCRVCMKFNGETVCETARAADVVAAQMQATQSACSQIARNVTDSFVCPTQAPVFLECTE